LECVVFMGALDCARQSPNVERMRMLGAEVREVRSGTQVLKDATNEAIRDWIAHPLDTHYIIGSTVGPHPYPDMVARFQSVISEELKQQLTEQIGRETPDYILACVGGGSNAMGSFYHYLDQPSVKLYGVEAAGEGLTSGRSAATLALGSKGVLHGSCIVLMQTRDGQVEEAHSASAGLDYPGVGPQHSYLCKSGRAKYVSVTDDEAFAAALQLTRIEGIIPALESAHALAYLGKLGAAANEVVVVILSGRGDKDMAAYLEYQKKQGG
jgi:tryptophan synthase beta chain